MESFAAARLNSASPYKQNEISILVNFVQFSDQFNWIPLYDLFIGRLNVRLKRLVANLSLEKQVLKNAALGNLKVPNDTGRRP